MPSLPKKCPQHILETFTRDVVVAQHYPEYTTGYNLKTFFNGTDFGRGGFGNSTSAFLYNPAGDFLAVIKGYSLESANVPYVAMLIPACDMLRQLPLHHSRLALPFATAHYLVDDQHYQTIATAATPGRSIIDYLAAYATTRDSPQKENALSTLLRAVAQTATALAELHAFSPYIDRPISPYLLNLEDAVISYFLDLLDYEPHRFPFSSATFKEHFEPLFHAAYAIPLRSGYIHGDSNATNIFYSQEQHQITFIDSLTLFHSIDNQGYPSGNITQDYAFCRFSFALYGYFYGCSPQELAIIDHVFTTAYYSQNPLLEHPAPHLHFYQLFHWIAYAKVVDSLLHTRPHLQPKLNPLLQYILQQIADVLQIPPQ